MILNAVEKEYPIINQAANDFLNELSGNDIMRDIALAAEMAGLKLLRAADINLSGLSPGQIILGAIDDSTFEQINRFVFGWALSNGLDPTIQEANIPKHAKNYLPEVVQLEPAFDKICERNGIKSELVPFVAITAALKLVFAGQKLGLLDASTGLAMVLYHIIAGSKTVPYPLSTDEQ